MDRLLVKHLLLDKNLRLVELARRARLPYDRLIRIVHGYRTPRQEEIEAIAEALDVSVVDLGAEWDRR